MAPGNFSFDKLSPYLHVSKEPGTIAIYQLRYGLTGLYMVLVVLAAMSGFWPRTEIPGPSQSEAIAAEIPTRDSLVATFWEDRKLMFVYGSDDSKSAEQYKRILENGTEKWDYLEVAVRSDKEVTEQDIAEWSLFLVGTPDENSLIRRFIPGLPFSINPDSLAFNGKVYREHPVFTLTFYPLPGQPKTPVSLFTGSRSEDIVEFMGRQHWRWFSFYGWGYQVYNQGSRVVMGHFDDRPGKVWQVGGELHWDYSDPPRNHGTFGNVNLVLHDSDMPKSVLDSAGTALEKQMQTAIAFFPKKRKTINLDWHVYSSTENKGLQTRNTHQVHIDGQDIYQALAPEYQGYGNAEPLRPLLRAYLGHPKPPILETGLAIYLTDDWQRKGWAYWAALLQHSGNAMPLQELLDKELIKIESPLVTGCLGAAFVDFLIKEYGKEKFLSEYGSFSLGASQINQMQQDFDAHLDGLVQQHQASFPARRSMAQALPSYQKGFNFAHEGYQVYNGYISSAATRSLAYTADELHCNVTAIIPYTGMPDPQVPNYLHIAEGAGTENDESVVHCIWGAKQAGMQSLLKPQVWLYKGWPGSVEMSSEEDWQAFFGYYYRWMRHYTLLAEMYDADALCLGVEFQEATLKRPNDWRKLIRKFKGMYSGPVTYAANWGREFEGLEFWDELDFIGLNCYYPLSDKTNATERELKQGFETVLDRVEKIVRRNNKPLVFTEIGFPSLAAIWQEPHAEPKDRAASTKDQASCYSVMIDGLQRRDWCAGVYLWKWPAYPKGGRGRELTRGFTPKGKPAEKMVKDWFKGI